MSAGRTTWYARDAAFMRRELIVELGEDHGPGGVTVMDALLEWAQEQRSDGSLRGGWRSLARAAFVTVDEARAIVEHAAELGAVDDLVIDGDGRRFTCRVSGWQADQERGRAAFRKAAQRARADAEQVPPDGDGDTGEVTVSRPSGTSFDGSRPSAQPDHRVNPPESPPGGGEHLPDPPTGNGRKRDRDRYASAVKQFAMAVYRDDSPELLTAIDQAARYERARTPDQVSRFLREHWPQLEVAA